HDVGAGARGELAVHPRIGRRQLQAETVVGHGLEEGGDGTAPADRRDVGRHDHAVVGVQVRGGDDVAGADRVLEDLGHVVEVAFLGGGAAGGDGEGGGQ